MEEEKESELAEAQEELRVAQEEVLLLQQAAEEAAAERENDIASLQEELCRRRAELQRLTEETQEYELEITTLRAEISMKSQRREAERREGEDMRRNRCGAEIGINKTQIMLTNGSGVNKRQSERRAFKIKCNLFSKNHKKSLMSHEINTRVWVVLPDIMLASCCQAH